MPCYRFLTYCLSLFIVAMLPGCVDETVSEPVPPVRTAEDPESADTETTSDNSDDSSVASAERQDFDGLGFVVPAGWKKVALSQFQMGIITAKFEMPDAGPNVSLTLSRSGGGLQANLDRWRGQFSASRPEVTETLSVAGTDATLIDLQGRFSAGFGREPQDGWRMLGIVVPLPEQSYFLKLTGPLDEVKAVEDEFIAFAKSAHPE